MENLKYIPILKTTAAELKGYNELSDKVKEGIVPLFELTKDRTHKKLYPDGRLAKALEKVLKARSSGEMILDLTSEKLLTNSEIERLFNEANGYDDWCSFVGGITRVQDIIPVIQIAKTPNVSGVEITEQTKKLLQMCDSVVFRAKMDKEKKDFDVSKLSTLLGHVCNGLNSLDNLIVIIDVEYIRPNTAASYAQRAEACIRKLKNDHGITNFAVTASSFPSSVVQPDYGDKYSGDFKFEEIILHSLVSGAFQNDIEIIYSDYASIHPFRYETRGGSWVPRVDAPLEDIIYYYRYLRENGGYISAAKDVASDSRYILKNSWGKDQIDFAKTGNPQGRRPEFWISVRTNIHMTTQAVRTGAAIP